MLNAPEEVLRLIEAFGRNIEEYRKGRYNETMVRWEYLDPLFKALGWDVDNSAGYAEAYKEVVHEDAIKVGAPGYDSGAPAICDRLGS